MIRIMNFMRFKYNQIWCRSFFFSVYTNRIFSTGNIFDGVGTFANFRIKFSDNIGLGCSTLRSEFYNAQHIITQASNTSLCDRRCEVELKSTVHYSLFRPNSEL